MLVANAASRVTIETTTIANDAIGLSVTGGFATLVGNTFSNNATAVRADGDGGSDVVPIDGTTRVRVVSGTFVDNTTVFVMDDAGTRNNSACNGVNIWTAGGGVLNIAGFTTLLTVSGTTDTSGGCGGAHTLGGFNSPQG